MLLGDCQNIIKDLCDELGWKNDLEKLIEKYILQQVSTKKSEDSNEQDIKVKEPESKDVVKKDSGKGSGESDKEGELSSKSPEENLQDSSTSHPSKVDNISQKKPNDSNTTEPSPSPNDIVEEDETKAPEVKDGIPTAGLAKSPSEIKKDAPSCDSETKKESLQPSSEDSGIPEKILDNEDIKVDVKDKDANIQD